MNNYSTTNVELDKPSKNRTLKMVLLGIVLVVLLVGGIFGFGYMNYPFEAKDKNVNVYIYQGEEAKASLEFENKKGSSKTLNLDLGKYGKKELKVDGKKSGTLDLDFKDIKESTKVVGKYGFLNMKKVNINITSIPKSDITLATDDIDITTDKNKDISDKKYHTPNSEITFKAYLHNKSNKSFERDIDFKVNGKVIDTKRAIWKDDTLQDAMVSFKYKFTKQGYYKITIGDTSINFIASTKDKAPSNGTILQQKSSGGSGVLKLKNKFNYDVIVTLAKSSSPNKAQNRIYIKAKKSATMNGVRNGTYIMYVKAGSGYSKIAKDILEVKEAYKSDSKLRFTTTSSTYTIWQITLGVGSGNMNTDPIDENSVPR